MKLNKLLILFLIPFVFSSCIKANGNLISLKNLKGTSFYSIIKENEIINSDSILNFNSRINGYTVLQYLVAHQLQDIKSCELDNIEVLKSYILNGAKINSLFETKYREIFDVVGVCIRDHRNRYLGYILSQIDFKLPDLDDTGGNYLQLAINCSNPIIIYDLIPYIKDINGKNAKKQTVLHYAAAANTDYDIIRYLIKSGADKSIKDINGKTACDIYVEYFSMYDDVFELLKNK